MRRVVFTTQFYPVLRMSHHQREAAMQALNLAIIGMKHCNCYDETGKLVAVNAPKDSLDRLLEAHRNVNASNQIVITADVFDDGEVGNFRVGYK